MNVFQEVSKDKYGATFVNTDLTQCFNVFLTTEDLKDRYLNKTKSSYDFSPSNFKNWGTLNKVSPDSYIQVADGFYADGGATIRFILIEALVKDAVVGLADGQKVWPFDPEVEGYETLITYNTYFKCFGVQYSKAKGGFVPAKPVADQKLPIGVVNNIKRQFVLCGVHLLNKKAPGADLSINQLTNAHTEAGCSLLKQLGYTLDDLFAGDEIKGLDQLAKYYTDKAGLTDKHHKELIETIKEWWSSL